MKLAKREKYVVILGTFAVAIFLLVQLVVFPFIDRKSRLVRGVETREKGLREMNLLASEYRMRRQEASDMGRVISSRPRDFALFSFLERAASDSAVRDHIKYMKPSTTETAGPYKEMMVEMRLEKITLEQLVNYLYRVESPERLIGVKRLSVTEHRREAGYMDAVMQVITYE
jgi:general secretion pathway protein M